MTRAAHIRLALVALGACAAPATVTRSTFVRALDYDGDMGLAVVEDPRLSAHEPQPVTPEVVAGAMMASGLLLDEDVAQLAAPVAEELAEMEASEAVRVTAWSDDQVRRTFIWIHDGKLQLAYHRGDVALETWAGALPTAAVPVLIPDGAPVATPRAPAATADAGPARAPVSPRSVVAGTKPPRHGRCPAPSDRTSLSEDRARQKLGDLDRLLGKGLITQEELRCKRKDILARL